MRNAFTSKFVLFYQSEVELVRIGRRIGSLEESSSSERSQTGSGISFHCYSDTTSSYENK